VVAVSLAVSPVQAFPLAPPAFAKQGFGEADITDISPEAHSFVLNVFRNLRSGPMFTPPSVQGTIMLPGNLGGANWSGASFDPATGMLYVNSNNIPKVVLLRPTGNGAFPYEYSLTDFADHEGYPGVKPPWGQLSAIDMNSGTLAWQATLGEHPELIARGLPPTGTENLGGSIVTAGGLVFIAATTDEMFRAFDKTTGQLLWQYKLPAAGHATPSTYQVNGKQYVVVAAGGGRLNTPTSDAFVAFTLP
jgi:quinoprotein glucose dehydrogenase